MTWKNCKTSPRVVRYLSQIETITKKMSEFLENEDFNGLKQLIENLKIVCPVSGA